MIEAGEGPPSSEARRPSPPGPGPSASDLDFSPAGGEVGERVDAVAARRTGRPRAAVQAALRDGLLTVSGARVRPSHRLALDDVVAGRIPTPANVQPQAEPIPLEVRYSDKRVLVVSKPAGLVTHPGAGHESGTLVNALLALGEPLAAGSSGRPGIVHRLDKDTSGLLLVAKDDEAHAFLVAALAARRVERRYLALVAGPMPAPTGTVDAPVGRHPHRPRLRAVARDGKAAVTHYRTLASALGVSLLEVTLDTGRTHQIRVHLGHLGHPVVGDAAYGAPADLGRALGLRRPFLHAWKLAWPDPSGGGRRSVADELATDLAAALERAGVSGPA